MNENHDDKGRFASAEGGVIGRPGMKTSKVAVDVNLIKTWAAQGMTPLEIGGRMSAWSNALGNAQRVSAKSLAKSVVALNGRGSSAPSYQAQMRADLRAAQRRRA